MNGMDATTGKALDGTAHLVQSIADILGTPLGSRVMRRDYGSLLFDLIDQPVNAATALLLRAASAIAIRRWEPRLKVTAIDVAGDPAAGSLTIRVTGTRTDIPAANQRATLTIPLPALVRSANIS